MCSCREWASGTLVREFRYYAIKGRLPVRQLDVERLAQLRSIQHRPRRPRGFGGIFIGADRLHDWRLLDQTGGLCAFENRPRKTAPTGLPRRDKVIDTIALRRFIKTPQPHD